MHARFNLDPESRNWTNYLTAGRTIHSENKAVVEKNLETFKNANGDLQAKKIIENWFPEIKSNVFLSHSHNDQELVIGFAGWLKETFGLKSFIDSTVWGYSDQLLKLIDDEYCFNSSSETYVYSKRNRSTSHVHMMLSTALMDMIDRCECTIFINTQSSFKPSEYFKSQGQTESPWIYSEIAMTRMLRERLPKEHRDLYISKSASLSLEHFRESKELRIEYPADLLHLTPLNLQNLDAWAQEESNRERGASSLDSLYNMMKK
ncbi:hypothetical protein HUU62_10930 [Rhodoferax sp. 4810]|nr:hypothetical protein [Rhodoferax jenense]